MEKMIKKASLQFVNSQTLIIECTLSLGVVEKLSPVEKLRQTLQKENPEFIVLAFYEEVLNPDYSPLTSVKNETDK